MTHRKYIIKNLGPWMMDELIAFSKFTKFEIIFLRVQDSFYNDGLNTLESNGIIIHYKPFNNKISLKKLLFVIRFFLSNLNKFGLNYNGVIGLKSLIWFLRLDMSLFSNDSNIHAQFATQASVISLLIKRYFKNQPKYSFTFHAYDIYFKNKWLTTLVNNCHKAFSISEYNINYVIDNYKNIKREKLTLSRLGVFRPQQIAQKPLTTNGELKLGIISWFVEKKGIKYLLEAFKILKDEGFDGINLELAGDGPLKNQFLEFINENGLQRSVNYLGKLNNEQKPGFFSSLDAFILPSIKLKNDHDGIPVVLMEAISYGLPIISTNVSGIPEICIDNYNGYLIEEKNVNAIITAIKNIFKSRDNLNRLKENSIRLSQEYDIIKNSKEKIKHLGWI